MENRIFIVTQGINEAGRYLYDTISKSGGKVRFYDGAQPLNNAEIEEKISTCTHVIIVINRRVEEPYIYKIINWAVEYRKSIIPITNRGFVFPDKMKQLNSCPSIESTGNNFSEILKKLNAMVPNLNLTAQKITPNKQPLSFAFPVNPAVPYSANGDKNIEIGLSMIEKFRWPLLLLLLALLVICALLYSPEQNQNVIIYSPKTESVTPHEESKKQVKFSSFSSTAGNVNVQQAVVSGNGNVVQQQINTQAVNLRGNGEIYQYSVQQMGNAFDEYDSDCEW